MDNLSRLERQAKRATTIMEREQIRGRTNLSVQQTRRMYYSVTAAQRAASALARERLSLRLIQGGRA